MDYNFTTRDLPDKWFSVSIFYTWKWMVLAIYCFLCVKKVFFYKFFWLLHKLSPNWPRAGNSSGSISDQALLAAWIYSLFGKVKVIYKHYQKPFPMHTMTKTSLRNKFHLGGNLPKRNLLQCPFLFLPNCSHLCIIWSAEKGADNELFSLDLVVFTLRILHGKCLYRLFKRKIFVQSLKKMKFTLWKMIFTL